MADRETWKGPDTIFGFAGCTGLLWLCPCAVVARKQPQTTCKRMDMAVFMNPLFIKSGYSLQSADLRSMAVKGVNSQRPPCGGCPQEGYNEGSLLSGD